MKRVLHGKVAIVTGASGSLGGAIGRRLAVAGAAVVLTDIDPSVERLAGELSASGLTASFHSLDVRSESDWSAATDATVQRFGGLDIVVNNAGIECFATLRDVDVDDVRRLFDVNVLGVLLGIKHGLRCMSPGGASGRGGSIVNIASAAALGAHFGMGPYVASKAAVERLTKVAAVEAATLKTNVRVNCVMPGAVEDSGMFRQLLTEVLAAGLFPTPEAARDRFSTNTPAGRGVTLDEVTNAVLYLASDEAGFVNGVHLPIDGGNHLA